jgi:hypothetical protein
VVLSDPFYKTSPELNVIPPTAVGGYFRSFRRNLNNPPTTVGGIRCRKDLNEPPTTVGGIRCRENLNEPPTPWVAPQQALQKIGERRSNGRSP